MCSFAMQGSMPSNTLKSYYGGKITKKQTRIPFFTAKIAGCTCPN